MPPALKAYWAARRGKSRKKTRARGRGRLTVTDTHTVRRVNPRRALVVLYARKGRDTLKYLGNLKFGKKGKARLFKSVAMATLTGQALREAYPQALRGFRMTARRAAL